MGHSVSKWSRRCTATFELRIVGTKPQTVRCCGVHSTSNHVGPIPKPYKGEKFLIWNDENPGMANSSRTNPEKYKSAL
jgi:hypothetical protein